ncbi:MULTISPECIES: hypothetical protein [unclassified Kitasatospora]|uniref:hypothetical protein n=1 Tax=unclassified Kitasatospora TaxID=2633591 RepID=UPI0007104D5B|nr:MULTISPECIES: hypothetical protein [unclassified Kitasatospora]KQV13205.1 hypothetical protein ASC99_08175 [Kitasatospora sp. Root107]KRB75347.1 hypothetical protein ASE03_15225 [Kitasatospora sp. Root187]
MSRTDLLALDLDTLAALTNRGLVKRAARELDAGQGPTVSVGADGTLHARFPDGTETVLPPGTGPADGGCGCGAAGACRHLVGLVLAHQREAITSSPAAPGSPDATPPDWSPGATDDQALAVAVGQRSLATARRSFDRGYPVRLYRATPAEPVPRAELPTCTVRFPVPGELGYALTEASADRRGEAVALAVWAFRAADERGLTGSYVELDVGGRPSPTGAAGLGPALDLADELLLEGVVNTGPVFVGALRRCAEDLVAEGLHWPAGAVAELAGQVDDHAGRSARYRPERHALLLAELHARHRAAQSDTTAAARVLGSHESGETPLRRVRLVALGCRIGGTERERVAEVFFAPADAGTVLVLGRRWELTDGQQGDGPELTRRRLLGSTLGALASANLVSENATRTASRAVTVARGRVGANSVTPVGTSWTGLAEPVLIRDFAAHAARLDRLPPRLIRPRVEAEDVHLVEVAGVEDIGYDPAEQTLHATVLDPNGARATVLAAHNPFAPGALDALARALRGEVHRIAAVVRRSGGGLLLDPIAVLTADGVTVPDLSPGSGSTALGVVPERPADPILDALTAGLATLAALAHQGLRHLDRSLLDGLADTATRLDRVGLRDGAGLLRAVLTTCQEPGPAATPAAWTEAQLYLAIAAELHAEGTSD